MKPQQQQTEWCDPECGVCSAVISDAELERDDYAVDSYIVWNEVRVRTFTRCARCAVRTTFVNGGEA